MRTISLQPEIIYGPLESRRFGKSLGINLLPRDRKVCSLSCVYCQYADDKSASVSGFPAMDEVVSDVRDEFPRIADKNEKINWITFAGNGEPTLHPHFNEIVEEVLSLRDRYLPGVSIGILSNSTMCHKEKIRQGLLKLDGRFMKLDAGTVRMFCDIDRPLSTLVWGDVIYGLSNLPGTTLQSMFVTGKVDNTDDRTVDDWIDVVRYIQPIEVQIYTVDRTPQVEGILPVDLEKLRVISNRLRMKTLIPSTVYG